MSSVAYELQNLPEGIVARTEENAKDKSILKWSGVFPIPQIGDSVSINFNELGTGKVESYFVEHGFVGIKVALDKEPEWKKKQHAGTKHAGIAMVFGREIL